MLITEEEIRKIRADGQTIDPLEVMEKRIMPIARPTMLASGYKVAMSFDLLHPNMPPFEHISISNSKGTPDPADAEHIAKAILGNGYIRLGPAYSPKVTHFVKAENKEQKAVLNHIKEIWKNIRK